MWGEKQQTAWDAVKALVLEDAVLATPNSRDKIHVVVDACDYAVGGILIQIGRVVAYEGRKLTETERKWGVREKGIVSCEALCEAMEMLSHGLRTSV